MFLAGCVGLGDTSLNPVAAERPQRQRDAEPSPPAQSISDYVVAQSGSDIPLVPVPPPPFPRPPAGGTTSASGAASEPRESSRGSDATPLAGNKYSQPDGTTPSHTARQLIQQAAARCATLDSYIVRLTRRENNKGKLGPEEILAFSFRRQPFSVHFKWLGKTAEGREVVYVKDRFDNKIHTKVAAGDSLLLPAGARLSLSPENPLVRAASHHPITDAGVCRCVEMIAAVLDAQEHGDRSRGTLAVLPPQRRPEYPQPVETMERLIPPGLESDLPHGGRRLMYFDPQWQLPMLVITYDDKGNEIEYYHYDRLITPVHLDDDDFNPDKLWRASPANGRRQPAGEVNQPADAARSPARR